MNAKKPEITTYNKQLKKERTLEIVKGLMTVVAFLITLLCLFLMIQAK